MLRLVSSLSFAIEKSIIEATDSRVPTHSAPSATKAMGNVKSPEKLKSHNTYNPLISPIITNDTPGIPNMERGLVSISSFNVDSINSDP